MPDLTQTPAVTATAEPATKQVTETLPKLSTDLNHNDQIDANSALNGANFERDRSPSLKDYGTIARAVLVLAAGYVARTPSGDTAAAQLSQMLPDLTEAVRSVEDVVVRASYLEGARS